MNKTVNFILSHVLKKITFLNYSDEPKEEILNEVFSEVEEELQNVSMYWRKNK